METTSGLNPNKFTEERVDICTIVFSSGASSGLDHFDMISRCLGSILESTDPHRFRLWIGCNNASGRVMELVEKLSQQPNVSFIVGKPVPDRNGHAAFPKYPLMGRLFAKTRSQWLVWFDDDSFVTSPTWLQDLGRAVNANPDVAQFGKTADVPLMNPAPGWVESAAWFNPETIHETVKGPDGVIRVRCPFIVGGFYALRRDAMEKCRIPDPRLFHNSGDWTTGLALKHQGFKPMHYTAGVAINTAPRRGIHEDAWSPPGIGSRLQEEAISTDRRLFDARNQPG